MNFSPRRESDPAFWLPLGLIAALLALRVVFLFRHAVDSDEAQHLHVIHEWLSGGIPYRDFFDNHTPLFHWLFLPFARLAGETPDVVLYARLAQIPISFGIVGLFYLLARRLYDGVTVLWALALTLALADWSLKALEFRPDVLWAALWFAALWVLAREPGWRTFFFAGILLGIALMVSVKTTFLLAGLGLGWTGAWVVSAEFRSAYPLRRIAECAVAAAAGFVVVPAIFAGWFAAHGALGAMRFCLLTVNQPEAPSWWRVALFLAGAPVALAIAWRMCREENGLRAAIFLAAAFYALLVIGFSPSLKKQTFLPVYPILILTAAGAVHSLRWRWTRQAEATACLLLLAHQVVEAAPWSDGMAEQRALLRDTLALTRPGDYVLDLKGETIFRRRPIYLAYVQATTRGIESGRLPDGDPARLSATGAAVVIGGGAGFPAPMRKFLKDHYVPSGDGRLRVAGNVLERKWVDGQWASCAELPVGGNYVVLQDGRTLIGNVSASAGLFIFHGEGLKRVLLYWKPAWDAGQRPLVSGIPGLR